MLTAAGRITHGPTDRRSVSPMSPNGPRPRHTELATHRSGGLTPENALRSFSEPVSCAIFLGLWAHRPSIWEMSAKRGPSLLELFGDGHEGYSAPESAPASCLSGECRLIEFMILALRVNGIDSIATGHWTIEFRAVFSMVRKGIRKMTTYHTQGDGR